MSGIIGSTSGWVACVRTENLQKRRFRSPFRMQMIGGMTPIEQCIKALYFGDRGHFTDDFEIFLSRGYVISTPEFFSMLRPVCSWWSMDELADQTKTAGKEADSWHIWQLTGCLHKALTMIPFPLTYVVACRKGRNRTYRLKTLERLAGIQRYGHHSTIGNGC